ncbi:MAG TPA: zinc-dependent alcohol dehydrogenase family protein [Mycobacteriales bacterium]|jgi:2-desacetyl-2-hydroxyethyl bacteriochlorophyllide A dehydrogenase|nr:zinc-dependent alcohol dehydrogenase family protein [Mycobacteriales bacterium]
MRAAVITEPGRIEVSTVDDPVPAAREVVVAVAGCGICGTDLHLLDGELPYRPYPVIPGHEFAGTVVAVGSGVTELGVGDRIAADPNVSCGECDFCRTGHGNLCVRYGALGVTMDGACAEYVRVPVGNCFVLPAGIPLEHAPLIEPLSCAVHGFDLLPGRVGEHFLIYGAGTMGLLMAQLAARAGAASVSVVDLNADRLAVATRLAAAHVASDAGLLDRPQGWGVVIDCTGAVPAIEDALTRVRPGGTFQVFGVAPAAARATFSPFDVYRNEITIVGSMAVLHSFGRAVDLLAAGAVDADIMISHRFGLDDYASAVDAFRAGTGRKLQILPGAS